MILNVRYKNEIWPWCRSQRNGSVHHRPAFCLFASAFRLHTTVINFCLKGHLHIIIDDPADYSISAHAIFCGHYIILQYKEKQVVAAAHVCSEESASTTLSRTVAKVAPFNGKQLSMIGFAKTGILVTFNGIMLSKIWIQFVGHLRRKFNGTICSDQNSWCDITCCYIISAIKSKHSMLVGPNSRQHLEHFADARTP